ncbi:MFS transporter [Enterococcus durans]|uniref:MFS transporter n=1 Tax=Enterococcus durans TaxID=53345 RepID=UPI0039A44471
MQRTKISRLEKLGFALTNLGNIPIMTLLNTYLLIFYTDVIGIAPATVSTLFLVSRLLDGISDPLIGFFIDRFPTTKFGKYRPILIIGTMICCINYLLVWFSPLLFTSHKIIAISLSYILLGVTFDLMDIPLNSLLPVLTNQENERNILSSIKGIAYTVGPTLLNVIAPLLLSIYSDGISGYLVLITGAVIVVLFFTIIGTLALKERVNKEVVDSVKEKNYSFKEVRNILKIRPVAILFVSMLFITAASNIFNGSLLYYLNYMLKDPRLLSVASLVGLFGALGAGMIVPKVSRKLGKKNLYTCALVLLSIAMVCLISFHKSKVIFLIAYVMVQIGLGLTNTLQYSLSADNVDLIRKELRIESAALLASFNSLIMKFAMAVGGAVPGLILTYTGYVANKEQIASASMGIILTTFIVPLILYLCTAAIFYLGYSPYLFARVSKKNLHWVRKFFF